MMNCFGIRKLRIDWSNSESRYPDIWCYPYEHPPRIMVTQEWRSHNMHLRRSQLVHELLHLVGYEHGKIGRYDYNTRPELDTYSKYVYRKLIG